ncbi:MAG: hypothetical protein R2932_06665 [Caldilineaceae bacterium]
MPLRKAFVPIRGFKNFVQSYESLCENLKQSNFHKITGVLLYTDEDIDLAIYVRNYFLELDRMSGFESVVYVIEGPININKAKKDNRIMAWLSKMAATTKEQQTSIAYNKAEAYDIAARLNILPKQLPCLVFFYELDQSDKICIPLPDNSYTKFFRDVFSHMQTVFHDAVEFVVNDSQSQYIYNDYNAFIQYLFTHLRQYIESQPRDEKLPQGAYSFYGHTVFIAGDVATKGDFVGHDKNTQGDEILGDKISGNKFTDNDQPN